MANNYLQFSGILTHLTIDEERWLRHALRDAVESVSDVGGAYDEDKVQALLAAEPWRDEDHEEYAPDFQFNFGQDKEDGSYLHVYAEESGSAWAVAQLAHAFLKQFRPTGIWAMNWATTCDKMRVDNFGGGAVVATAKEARAFDSYVWVDRMQQHFKRTGELPKVRKFKKQKAGRFKDMPEEEIIADRQWDDESLRIHLEGFINSRGLRTQYAAYLARCAFEEEEGEKSLEGAHTCRTCDGHGFLVNEPDPENSTTPCEDCGGTGRITCSPPCALHKGE